MSFLNSQVMSIDLTYLEPFLHLLMYKLLCVTEDHMKRANDLQNKSSGFNSIRKNTERVKLSWNTAQRRI